MAKLRVEGSFVAVITPFNGDGTVDYEGFRTNLALQEEHGTAAVLILGSTGEVSLLSREERHEVIRKTVAMRRGAMRFFYGCTANNTAETIAMVKFAKAEGADGAILAAPSYIAASEADIERYFLEVADATDLPLGVYNNPRASRPISRPTRCCASSSIRTSWFTRSRPRGWRKSPRSWQHGPMSPSCAATAPISGWSCRPWRWAGMERPT
jgi:dihydrodipicolinate synthase/N-acetylneuraminate lyase